MRLSTIFLPVVATSGLLLIYSNYQESPSPNPTVFFDRDDKVDHYEASFQMKKAIVKQYLNGKISEKEGINNFLAITSPEQLELVKSAHGCGSDEDAARITFLKYVKAANK